MEFKELGIIAPLLKAISELGHKIATPIQSATIPEILSENDIVGCAQTGTGKTAAFVLPVLQLISTSRGSSKGVKALIITPTRELASQISKSIIDYNTYTDIKHTMIFGGVPQKGQVDEINQGVELIVATPGRLLDLINQNLLDCSLVQYLVLDEADTLLDLGFLKEIKRLVKLLPSQRQTLLFSATMPKSIRQLANDILINPVELSVDPISSTSDNIDQRVIFLDVSNKPTTLVQLLNIDRLSQTLIFTRTKYGADKLVRFLSKNGYSPECIHGNKTQSSRERSLDAFRLGKSNILIATDIAARGIDIALLPRVINYDLPEDTETYVHRIGRTGRAGNKGTAISFCTEFEQSKFNKIENLIGFKMPIYNNNFLSQ